MLDPEFKARVERALQQEHTDIQRLWKGYYPYGFHDGSGFAAAVPEEESTSGVSSSSLSSSSSASASSESSSQASSSPSGSSSLSSSTGSSGLGSSVSSSTTGISALPSSCVCKIIPSAFCFTASSSPGTICCSKFAGERRLVYAGFTDSSNLSFPNQHHYYDEVLDTDCAGSFLPFLPIGTAPRWRIQLVCGNVGGLPPAGYEQPGQIGTMSFQVHASNCEQCTSGLSNYSTSWHRHRIFNQSDCFSLPQVGVSDGPGTGGTAGGGCGEFGNVGPFTAC